jgi:RHS repeat-associated protein
VSLEQARTDGTKINAAVDYFYDAYYNRIMRMHDGTGDTVYGYNPINPGDANYGDGRLGAVNSEASGALVAYTYDEYGRMKERTIDGANNTTTRSFDALGRIGSEVNPLGTFSYGYVGNTGRLSRVSNGQGFATEYGYHPIVPAVAGTGDGDLRLSAIKHYKNAGAAAGSGTIDAEYDYHYTPGGNISQWTQRWENLSAGNDYKLAYDPADELRGAEISNPITHAVRQTLGYGYDLAANRTLEQTSTPTSATASNVSLSRASYNNLNQLTSRTGGTGGMEVEGTVSKPADVTINGQAASAEWKNADGSYGFKGTANPTSAGLNNVTVTATDAHNPPNTATKTVAATSSGTAIPTLAYDDAGDMTSDGTRSYEWDAANRMVAIVYAGTGNRTEFTYDGMGRRVREVEKTGGSVTSTKRLVWDDLSIVEERSMTNAVIKRFYAHGEQRPATTNLLSRKDHLGSIRETTDATGAMQTRLDFDLWGRRTVIAGAGANEPTFAYTGHYWHGRSGLHLAMYRAYSAEMGRWLSRDPIGEMMGTNIYAYVAPNPVSYRDVLGLKPSLSDKDITSIELCAAL